MKRGLKILFIIFIVLVIIGVSFLIYSINEEQGKKLIGGERDEHGCLGPAGYSYDSEVRACSRNWELNEAEKQAAQIAVNHIKPYNSLTIIEVNATGCPGCFIVELTDKDFKQMSVEIENWVVV